MNERDAQAAARLVERLLTDRALRARFRRDPVGVSREAGASIVAAELSGGGGRAMTTLDPRESRSSLAGMMMAAAMEGAGVFELADNLMNAPPASARPAAQVLSHVRLPDAHAAVAAAAPPDELAEPLDADADADAPDVDDDADESADGEDEDDEEDEDEEDEDEEDEDEEDEDEEDEDEDEEDEDEEDEDEEDEDEEDEDDGEDDGDEDDGSDGDAENAAGGDPDDADGGDEEDGDGDGPVRGGEGALDLGAASGGYPGDDVDPSERAAWMGREAQKRGLPPELPVMASLVESGLKNLSGGDRDSIGLFQMRASIWDQAEYAGYAGHPERQLDWFLDRAEEVKRVRQARGLSLDRSSYGEWIADVERPAEQYRGRYQLRLDEAQGLLRQASDANGSGDAIDLLGGGHAGRRAEAALAEARKYLGTPYRWGGSTPQTGFDCSGLVQWAYAKAGIEIPRVTDQQILASNATKVGRRHLLPGDLVFFRDPSGYVHHVGMSLGGDKFLHAPHTGDVVKVSSLDEPYYQQQFTGARRFDEAASGRRSDVHVLPTLDRSQVRR